MDIQPQATTQSMSDDQELAKALAGVMPDAPEPAAPTPTPADTQAPAANPMQFEETSTGVPVPSTMPTPTTPAPAAPTPEPAQQSEAPQQEESPEPEAPATDAPAVPPAPAPQSESSDLDSIKKDALGELRPLMDKVELPAEEKFDTYLMLIRSTDDTTLIGPAHAAAQSISDEKRRAEALLDIIKEIDYLSHSKQAPAA